MGYGVLARRKSLGFGFGEREGEGVGGVVVARTANAVGESFENAGRNYDFFRYFSRQRDLNFVLCQSECDQKDFSEEF